jgi:hypothetical protein
MPSAEFGCASSNTAGGLTTQGVVFTFFPLLALAAVFGAVSGTAGVATGVALAGAAPRASRGVVMGGYSTALYLGLALAAVLEKTQAGLRSHETLLETEGAPGPDNKEAR